MAVRIDCIGGPFKKALAVAATLGAKGVELDARNTVRPSELSDTGLRQLRKTLDDFNLSVDSIRFQTRRGYDNPQDLERRVEATKAAMLLAYRLGAKVVVNQIGAVPESEDDPRWSALRDVLGDLGRYGARVGAFLAAETGTESGDQLEALLSLDDDAYVAVALNPGQLIINRHSVTDAITSLKQRILVVNAIDGVLDLAAGRGLSVPLGQGTADFPELLGRLEDIPYRGPFVVGRPDSTVRELREGIEYLGRL